MNKRIVSIIYELSQAGTAVTISGLAEEYKVSQRTIRNDLNSISSFLKENHLCELRLKSGGIVCKEDDFEKILPFLSDRDFYTYKLSKEERVKVAVSLLVNSPGYITLSAIADNLFVSRATIINDLDAIKKYVRTGNLQILSHSSKGLRVDGLESDKRMFLMKLADKQASDDIGGTITVQAGNRIVVQKILNEQDCVVDAIIDKIPGLNKIDISADSLQEKVGVLGEPIVIGGILGAVVGFLAGYGPQEALPLGVKMSAVMVLMPKVVKCIMDGLLPLSERAKEVLTKKFGNSEFYIGLDPAILLGDSQVVTAGLIFIPLTLVIAVLVPGNRVLPFGDLATIGFFIAIAVAVHNGNLFRTLFSGSLIMFMTIWIANQTIPWMTALAKTTGVKRLGR